MADPALDYALKLLGRRRLTVQQLKKKLFEKGFIDTVDEVIQRLQEWKYLDDAQYARLYIQSRNRLNPRGLALLRLELQSKGVPKDVVALATQEESLDEFQLADQILKKKLSSLQRFSPKERYQKAFRFLISRGFRSDVVYRVLSSVRCVKY